MAKCKNCEVDTGGERLCGACLYLSGYGTWTDPERAERARAERLTNRRWQMRFNRGEISADQSTLVKEAVRRFVVEYGEVLRRLADA